MITDFFVPDFHGINVNVNDVWFQQDDATCHTSHATINLLRQTFDGRLISRNGDINWSPISYDLTLRKYFLRDPVKKSLTLTNQRKLSI